MYDDSLAPLVDKGSALFVLGFLLCLLELGGSLAALILHLHPGTGNEEPSFRIAEAVRLASPVGGGSRDWGRD